MISMKNTTDMNTAKKKKRLRVSAIIRNEDDTSRLQFEESKHRISSQILVFCAEENN